MQELKKQWKSGMIHSCYLFYGSENYLKNIYFNRLKELLLDDTQVMMNLDSFEGKKIDVTSVLGNAQTLPFMSEKRFIVVKNSGLFQSGRKDESEKMAKFLPDIPSSTCVLFLENEVDKRGKLYKNIAKEGYVIECKPLSEKDLITWIFSYCKKNKLIISNDTGIYFIRFVGGEMNNILNEMEKIISSKSEGAEILKSDINEICIKSLETKIFDLVDAVGNNKPKEAVTIYRNLLMMKESPIMVLSMVIRQFRLIFQCMLLLDDGNSQGTIAAQISVRDFVVRECLRQSKNFSKERLREALNDCLKTDLAIKTGKINGELAVELLLLKPY